MRKPESKRLVFLQNCISPHQMPYIEALSVRSDVEHVWVFAPRVTYSDRAAMGWPETWTTSSEKMTICISPSDEQVRTIFSNEGCVCLFSGISAFPEVHHWFLLSVPYCVKRGIITEAPYIFDKPLWMHKLRFMLKDWRFVKYFDYVFAIGEECAAYYKIWSKQWKVVPFMYCTALPLSLLTLSSSHANSLSICFVGSLDRRKNVGCLLQAAEILKTRSVRLHVDIVGDGPLRDKLVSQASSICSEMVEIRFLGALPMRETQIIIASNDVLVLPSLHDGWGAVINEAMALGTVPVSSNKCGAKAIVKNSGFGGIFEVGRPDCLADILQQLSDDIERVRRERQSRIDWARKNISPDAVAALMIREVSN